MVSFLALLTKPPALSNESWVCTGEALFNFCPWLFERFCWNSAYATSTFAVSRRLILKSISRQKSFFANAFFVFLASSVEILFPVGQFCDKEMIRYQEEHLTSCSVLVISNFLLDLIKSIRAGKPLRRAQLVYKSRTALCQE